MSENFRSWLQTIEEHETAASAVEGVSRQDEFLLRAMAARAAVTALDAMQEERGFQLPEAKRAGVERLRVTMDELIDLVARNREDPGLSATIPESEVEELRRLGRGFVARVKQIGRALIEADARSETDSPEPV